MFFTCGVDVAAALKQRDCPITHSVTVFVVVCVRIITCLCTSHDL
jgi:hypothetical protein